MARVNSHAMVDAPGGWYSNVPDWAELDWAGAESLVRLAGIRARSPTVIVRVHHGKHPQVLSVEGSGSEPPRERAQGESATARERHGSGLRRSRLRSAINEDPAGDLRMQHGGDAWQART